MELSVLKTQRERQMAQALLEQRQLSATYTPTFNVMKKNIVLRCV
jgi:hypothetical protein